MQGGQNLPKILPGPRVTASIRPASAQYIQSPVSTLCVGQAASMASLLLAAGARGERRSLPNSKVMIHQPSGGASGQASDIAIHAKEILRTRERLNQLYALHTRSKAETIGEQQQRGQAVWFTLTEGRQLLMSRVAFVISPRIVPGLTASRSLISWMMLWSTRKSLSNPYPQNTLTIGFAEASMERDYFMTPEEAKEYGIIDAVIQKRPASPTDTGLSRSADENHQTSGL